VTNELEEYRLPAIGVIIVILILQVSVTGQGVMLWPTVLAFYHHAYVCVW